MTVNWAESIGYFCHTTVILVGDEPTVILVKTVILVIIDDVGIMTFKKTDLGFLNWIWKIFEKKTLMEFHEFL